MAGGPTLFTGLALSISSGLSVRGFHDCGLGAAAKGARQRAPLIFGIDPQKKLLLIRRPAIIPFFAVEISQNFFSFKIGRKQYDIINFAGEGKGYKFFH